MAPTDPIDCPSARVLRRTVAIFAGITKRSLVLVPGDDPGTDGNMVVLPFPHPDAYPRLEHLLAHVVFDSDPHTLDGFTDRYCVGALLAAERLGVTIDPSKLHTLVSGLVSVLDDVRVESLWAKLYPGTAATWDALHREEGHDLGFLAGEEVLPLAHCVAWGVPPTKGLEKLRRPLEQACERVRGRSVAAIPVVLRRLLRDLLHQFLEESRAEAGEAPQNDPSGGSSQDEQEQPSGGEDAPQPCKSPGKGNPSPGKMLEALSKLSEMAGEPAEGTQDVGTNRLPTPEAQERVRENLQGMEQEDSDEGLEQELDRAEKEAEDKLKELSEALAQPPPANEWETPSGARLAWVDVGREALPDPSSEASDLSPEDAETAGLLRHRFLRVLGKRMSALSETGYEVDLPSLLQRRVTRMDLPVFQHTVSGRGFTLLLLLDRSSSMLGDKTEEVERAYRILVEAMRLPFVRLLVWGFNTLDGARTTIYRYAKGLPKLAAPIAPVAGLTPLPEALRAAVDGLRGDSGHRVVLTITDGLAYMVTTDHRPLGQRQLVAGMCSEVRRALGQGIQVLGGVIHAPGDPLSRQDMELVFGRGAWELLRPRAIGTGLVTLVERAFGGYLRSL